MCQLVVEINFGSAMVVHQSFPCGSSPLKDGEKERKRSVIEADAEVNFIFQEISSFSSSANFTNSTYC